VLLGREVRMTDEARHIGCEPLEVGRVVHWESPHPRRHSGRGYTIIESHEWSASITGETSRCHAKTDASPGDYRPRFACAGG
jgi:hypothetical protein